MSERSGELRSFYENKIWKAHRISNPYEIARVQYLLNLLKEGPTNTVLDAGCGGGTYANILAEASSLIAVDVSSNAVRTARQTWVPSDNVFFIVCDLGHLPVKDMIVDKVACVDVLEHLDEPQKATDEIARVLRSRGRMLLFTACGENKLTLEYMLKPFLGRLINSIRSTLGHVNIFTTDTVLEMLSQDFVINRIEYMHHWVGWFFKFVWDVVHLNSPDGHQSQFGASGSSLSQILWFPLVLEYRLFRSRSMGTEIVVDAIKKSQ